MSKRIAIIGGGIIGLAVAHQILKTYPNTKLFLFEKEKHFGKHQSGRNSGVLHCGLYYTPGSLKAELAVNGIRQMTKFCQEHDIDHDLCGKVVVATNTKEEQTLLELADRGNKNGLTGLVFITSEQLKKREPHIKASKALLVPEEGIVDYKAVMDKMGSIIEQKNAEILLNNAVTSITETLSNKIIVHTAQNEVEVDILINCTGLFADRTFQKLTKQQRPMRIVPFRGEYLSFKPEYEQMVNHLIYPVPHIQYPFLGVHFTRMIDGEREVGPNAVLALKREGYKNTDFSISDTFDSLSYIGLYKFLAKNFRFSLGELATSFSKRAFMEKAKKMMPDLNENMLIKGNAGVRAQSMSHDGKLMMDFHIKRETNQIHILNAPSPGATASLAIADYIINNYLTDIN